MRYCDECRVKNRWPVGSLIGGGNTLPCPLCGKACDKINVTFSDDPPNKLLLALEKIPSWAPVNPCDMNKVIRRVNEIAARLRMLTFEEPELKKEIE